MIWPWILAFFLYKSHVDRAFCLSINGVFKKAILYLTCREKKKCFQTFSTFRRGSDFVEKCEAGLFQSHDEYLSQGQKSFKCAKNWPSYSRLYPPRFPIRKPGKSQKVFKLLVGTVIHLNIKEFSSFTYIVYLTCCIELSFVSFYIGWVFLVYDSPSVHPRISESEKKYILSSTAIAKYKPVGRFLVFNFLRFCVQNSLYSL